ncbi:hypothetical protein [Streptomyces sp. IBSBF 2806]|uniref:hypothetical protein n=1 Tax=Streptomyces sp. IBSBF 2806 TaxID=2903529 RepID=UPI003FA6DC86
MLGLHVPTRLFVENKESTWDALAKAALAELGSALDEPFAACLALDEDTHLTARARRDRGFHRMTIDQALSRITAVSDQEDQVLQTITQDLITDPHRRQLSWTTRRTIP